MKLKEKKKFEMPDLRKFEQQPEEQQEKQPETITPEVAEVQLTDGQTDNIPDAAAAPEVLPESLSIGLQQTTTINDGRFYSKDEFQEVFNSFFDFLKDPNAAADCFGTIQDKGRTLAAGRVYEIAQKYRWLNWLIDKQTMLIHDVALISLWAAVETNTIVLNWTGISIFEKGRIWLKSKIKQKAEEQAKQGKRGVLAFLGRRDPEKQQKQEN